jgi:hypothetical protein
MEWISLVHSGRRRFIGEAEERYKHEDTKSTKGGDGGEEPRMTRKARIRWQGLTQKRGARDGRRTDQQRKRRERRGS